MNIQPVGNRDRCGKCKTRHGGNNHLCDVHGVVSQGCCTRSCEPRDYVVIGKLNKKYPSLAPKFETKLRSEVSLTGATLDPPYMHQDDGGTGNYKPEYIERYVI